MKRSTAIKCKILLAVGLGVGYVLGARAGRERYEEIKRLTDKFWHSAGVQTQVHTLEKFMKDKAPDVAEFIADGAKRVVSQVAPSKKPAPARPAAPKTPATRSTTTKK